MTFKNLIREGRARPVKTPFAGKNQILGADFGINQSSN
jgi:hypothetical protein